MLGACVAAAVEGLVHGFQQGVGHETASGAVDVFVAVAVLLRDVVAERNYQV